MPLQYRATGATRPFHNLPLGWFTIPDGRIFYKGSRQTISLEAGEGVTLDPTTPCTPVAML